jgi:beta-glucosidase
MKPLHVALLAAAMVVPAFAADGPVTTPVYLDPAQPLNSRIRDLVSRLTLEEKATLMRNGSPEVARLGIPKYDWWSEALHGVARAGEATVFPQAIGLAAMWDDEFMRKIAGVIGVEARAKFHQAVAQGRAGERFCGLTFWSPNINIFRDPRWGRGQETYGEDPFLTARLGVAFVRGLQGDDPRYLLAAGCAKHFAVHSGPEPLRHNFDAAPPEADFRETYLPAFEALVREARVEAVMTAYNSLYGRPCSISPRLYALLAQWGFDGHVVSDCGSIADLCHTYRLAKDDAEAEALAVKAGLSLRCGEEAPALAVAVRRGLITEAEVDARLGALLRTMFRLGFFDPPERVAYAGIPAAENDSPAHGALALEATRKSIVLLKNDGVLPLQREALRRVAVIGPNADAVPVLLGNYNGRPSAPVTVLAGLKAALGEGVTVDYARGCDCVAARPGLTVIPRTGLEVNGGGLTGLWGDYFANPNLAGKPVARWRARPVDFHWRGTAPVAGVPAEDFSVRWVGTLLTGMTGDYQLSVTATGGFRLYLSDELVLDAWTPGEKTRAVTRHFEDNASTPIRLEYFQGGGPAEISLQWGAPEPASGFAAALAAARAADAIIFVGGISAQLEGEEMRIDYEGFEGGDRTRIELPAVQQRLLEALAATGKPLVFVLLSGSAIAIPWADAHLNAIVQAWYPGQAAGTAVADVLLGRYNPAGRLPVTFYRATEDLPAFDDYRMAGRTYRYFRRRPLYPFGHGLSYTRFNYSNLRVQPSAPGAATVLTASVEVSNIGDRDGDEVVQLYAVPPAATHPRELQALCGFRRLHLARGETQTVNIAMPATALRRWSTVKNDYVVFRGEWTIRVGASSADIRQIVPVKLE